MKLLQGDRMGYLNDVVRHEMDSTKTADLEVLTENVLRRVIEEDKLEEAFSESIRHYVAARVGVSRVDALQPQAEGSSRWQKSAEAISHYRDIMRERMFVNGEWKFLGDCTRDDVLAVAADRAERARTMAITAENYQRRADLMGTKRAKTVSALKVEQVQEVLAAA
jgi:hypothetical protein